MNITGSIDGLKKGTLYLQKISDSLIKNVDSIEIEGNSKYKLGDNISDSQVYYLYLKKNDGDTLNDRIPFFAEKGDIIINTRLATFESSAKISGSNNHIIWQEYKNINWIKVSKEMRSPAWVFDARSIVDPDKVLSAGLKLWRVGDGS